LSATYKILSNILLSRLTPYAEEIIWVHKCEFGHNKSSTVHIFCIRQILEKKWEYNEAENQLFINFKNGYDSVRREVLYNTLIESGIPMKLVIHSFIHSLVFSLRGRAGRNHSPLVRLIKMCLNETQSRVREGKHLSDMFPIKSSLKQGDALSPLFFNFALEYAIRRVQVNEDGLQLHSTYEFLFYANYVYVLGGSVHTKKTGAIAVASKEF